MYDTASIVDENTNIEDQYTLDVDTKLASVLATLNPEQYAAATAPIHQNTQVMAGAGTGKTHMMTMRAMVLITELLKQGHPNPTEALWIATFTDRAANELRERLDSMHRDILGKALPRNTWIGTFHSLSNRLLTQLKRDENPSSEAGESTILQDIDLLLFQDTLVDLLASESADSISNMLDISERPSATLDDLLSTWGIPNAEELVSDIVYRIVPRIKAAGLRPNEFESLALTQSRQFLQHIQNTPIQEHPDEPYFSSVESAARVWGNYYLPYATPDFQFEPNPAEQELIRLKAQAQGKSEPSELTQLKAAVKPLSASGRFLAYDGRIRKGSPYSLLSSEISAKTKTETRDLARDEALISLISWVYRVYQKQLFLDGVLDFDDLILETLNAFALETPETKALQHQFKHLLIDEFQDTNGSQLSLIQALSQGQTPITVVGDTKQSIYGFRFAQPENLDIIFNTRPAPQKITLKTNYRSTPAILKVANQAAYLMTGTTETDLFPRPESSQDAGEPVEWTTLDENPRSAEGLSFETRLITTEIETLLKENPELSPKDIAVLFPSHQKGIELEAALRAKQIPAIRQKALGFFDSLLMNALVSLFVWLDNPDDDMAFMHLLQLHLPDIDLLTLARLKREQQQKQPTHPVSYYQCFIVSNAVNPAGSPKNPLPDHLEAVKLLFSDVHKNLHDLLPHQIMKALIETPKIFNHLFPQHTLAQEHLQDADAMQHLQLVLEQWANLSPSGKPSSKKPRSRQDILKALLRAQTRNELTLPLGTSDSSNTIDAVMLLTIHAAKGLEFPIVFYAGVDNYRTRSNSNRIVFEPQYDSKPGFGLFLKRPNGEGSDDIKSIIYKTFWETPRLLQERQRLQYVGFTRAKKRLFIYSGSRSFKYERAELFGDRVIITTPVSPVTQEPTSLVEAL